MWSRALLEASVWSKSGAGKHLCQRPDCPTTVAVPRLKAGIAGKHVASF